MFLFDVERQPGVCMQGTHFFNSSENKPVTTNTCDHQQVLVVPGLFSEELKKFCTLLFLLFLPTFCFCFKMFYLLVLICISTWPLGYLFICK